MPAKIRKYRQTYAPHQAFKAAQTPQFDFEKGGQPA
jgi:hypothetical protein